MVVRLLLASRLSGFGTTAEAAVRSRLPLVPLRLMFPELYKCVCVSGGKLATDSLLNECQRTVFTRELLFLPQVCYCDRVRQPGV